MKQVWKYQLLVTGTQELQVPDGAEFLSAQLQAGQLCVWALVDPAATKRTTWLRVAGTGHPITETILKFIGTFQMSGGALVFHVFEVQK